MTDFENKIVDLLSKLANGKFKEVEYMVNNDELCNGKVLQTVTFAYEVDNTKEKNLEPAVPSKKEISVSYLKAESVVIPKVKAARFG